MICIPRPLELLAPAADKHVAFQAILHGADAVYIGGPGHGARSKAANSIKDIAEVVEFAHKFRVRVYVTVNTLVYDDEIKQVEEMVWGLYRVGVDAIIEQDMALLRMKLPPIALHASTQCDTRTVGKANFLQDVGFSQIVLARELNIEEIRKITSAVSVPVECFVHGALCVSYSGRCSASCVSLGRSANRGECAQMCRMPYTLRNGRGEVIEKDKYLLSLKDLNTLSSLHRLVEAGVSSFKIEGRLKDAAYVKNITAAYRRELDRIILEHPDLYVRASLGEVSIDFTPGPEKSFNRGFTDYFLGAHPGSMASLATPKSMGEVITDVADLHNGDGISFFNAEGEYEGVGVNRVEGSKIIGSRPFVLPKNATVHRTLDKEWQKMMSRETASRRISVDIVLDESGVSASDERGVSVRLPLEASKSVAEKPMNPEGIFSRLGNTVYRLRNFENRLNPGTFIPASQLTALRRRLTEALDKANLTTYPFDYRRSEIDSYYPSPELDARDNVANHLAGQFYKEHGVKSMKKAVEVRPPAKGEECVVMTTRYCLRRELGCCLKDKNVGESRRKRYAAPLTISTGPHTFRLDFDCARCEMNVVRPGKKSR